MKTTKVLFFDAVIEGGSMYFFDNLSQCVCSVSLSTYALNIIAEYRGQKCKKIYKIFMLGHKLYLLGSKYGEVLIYDKRAKEFYIKGIGREVTCGLKYELYKDCIFCFPNDISVNIYYFDLKTEEISFQNIFSEFTEKCTLSTRISRYKNMLCCCIKDEKFYVRYDLDKTRIENKIYVDHVNTISVVRECGKQTWIVDNNLLTLVCFENEKKLKTIALEDMVSNIVDLKDVLCVLFRNHPLVMFIDKKLFTIKKILLPIRCNDIVRTKDSNFASCIEDEFYFYILPWGYSEMLKVSKRDYICKKVVFIDINESLKKINLLKKHEVIKESSVFNFQDYIMRILDL